MFLPMSTQVVKILTDILTGVKNCDIVLSVPALKAFKKQIKNVVQVVKLSHVLPGNLMCLMVDASFIGVSAVLQKKMGDKWELISLLLKKLTPTKTRYTTFGQNIPAAYLAVLYFRHLFEERTFFIYIPNTNPWWAPSSHVAKTNTLQPSYRGHFKVLKKHLKLLKVGIKEYFGILPWTV